MVEISTKQVDNDQSDLLVETLNFRKKVKPKNPKKKQKKKQQKKDVLKHLYNLFEGRESVLNAFDSKIFPITTEDTGFSDQFYFKILTPKQMLQRLPIALVQVKDGNTSENLLNEIKQIIYSLYRAKEITKKVYNNIMNSIKV